MQPNWRRMFQEVFRQAHQQAAATQRKYQRTTAGQRLKNLGSDVLVTISPKRIEMGMHEIAIPFGGDGGGVLEKSAAAPGDFDQLDTR